MPATYGVAADAVSYTSAISGCERAGEWMAAVQLFRQMRDAGVNPTMLTYSKLLFVHAAAVTRTLTLARTRTRTRTRTLTRTLTLTLTRTRPRTLTLTLTRCGGRGVRRRRAARARGLQPARGPAAHSDHAAQG